ncbi:MAG: hypothetical protein GY926_08755 [bacterium]|nr:hypothetical protein [bacterium]
MEKPEGVYRILCVGGSTTYGTSCTKDEFSYPAQLEAMLAKDAPGKKYEVINCGVSGYGTVENLINIELRLLELDPDAIIVYHAANDARPIQARGFKSDYSHLRTNWHVPESNKLDYNLLRISRFYAWMTRGRDPEKRARALFSCIAVEDFEDLHQPSNLGVPEEGIAAFARNLKSMVAIARANDVELVLSTFASCRAKFKPDGEHFLDTIDRINDAVTELAAELNIAPKLSDKPKIFSDWMHLTDEGCKLQAQAVYDEAKRIGALGL